MEKQKKQRKTAISKQERKLEKEEQKRDKKIFDDMVKMLRSKGIEVEIIEEPKTAKHDNRNAKTAKD